MFYIDRQRLNEMKEQLSDKDKNKNIEIRTKKIDFIKVDLKFTIDKK